MLIIYMVGLVQHLPINNFKWGKADEWNKKKIMNIKSINTSHVTMDEVNELGSEYKKGYFFEVDLDYPRELHDLHND